MARSSGDRSVSTVLSVELDTIVRRVAEEKDWSVAKTYRRMFEWTLRQLDRAGSIDAMLRMDLPLTSPERIAKDAELLRTVRPTKARKSTA
jgi:hypothetical protein